MNNSIFDPVNKNANESSEKKNGHKTDDDNKKQNKHAKTWKQRERGKERKKRNAVGGAISLMN